MAGNWLKIIELNGIFKPCLEKPEATLSFEPDIELEIFIGHRCSKYSFVSSSQNGNIKARIYDWLYNIIYNHALIISP